LEDVREALLSEWQNRWDTSIKGRQLFRFFPSVHDRLTHIIPAPHLRYTYILPSNKYYKLSD
jgi:hypothetical protein